jgi:hydrogenase expression/formation protein HypC
MCIAVPMQVLAATDHAAECRDGSAPDRQVAVDLALVGVQPPGTWLLVFLGAAREVIDAGRARQTLDALAALRAVERGEPVEHLFADLIGREPELPEHLRPAVPLAPAAGDTAAATTTTTTKTTTSTEVTDP